MSTSIDFTLCESTNTDIGLHRYSYFGSSNELVNALLIDIEIRKKALNLMERVQPHAEMLAIRASFFETSQKCLNIENCNAYHEIRVAGIKAQNILEVLFMVAKGISKEDHRIVTTECWNKVLTYAEQL